MPHVCERELGFRFSSLKKFERPWPSVDVVMMYMYQKL